MPVAPRSIMTIKNVFIDKCPLEGQNPSPVENHCSESHQPWRGGWVKARTFKLQTAANFPMVFQRKPFNPGIRLAKPQHQKQTRGAKGKKL